MDAVAAHAVVKSPTVDVVGFLEEFANENNIWRSAHMAVEEAGAADVMADR